MPKQSQILSDSRGSETEQPPIYDNIMGERVKHPCKQEKRITNLEKRQADDMTNISKKLNLIWTAINDGDKDNMKMLLQVVGIFVGALVAVTLGFVAIIKLL